MSKIIRLIKANDTTRTVSFVCISTPQDLYDLADAFKNNTVVKHLIIDIGSSISLDANCGRFLKQILDARTLLEKISLFVTKIEDSGIEVVSAAIEQNNKLKKFGIWGSNISDKQLSLLSDVLGQHKTITHIEIVSSDNSDIECFGEKGATALAKAVSSNLVVTKLELVPALHKLAAIDLIELTKIIKTNTNIDYPLLWTVAKAPMSKDEGKSRGKKTGTNPAVKEDEKAWTKTTDPIPFITDTVTMTYTTDTETEALALGKLLNLYDTLDYN